LQRLGKICLLEADPEQTSNFLKVAFEKSMMGEEMKGKYDNTEKSYDECPVGTDEIECDLPVLN